MANCVGTLVGGLLLLYALMILVDPYDTGKFGFLGIDGVDDRNTLTSAASRARDPNFDSAIIGNSTAQMLEPTELSKATGLNFVQLYMTGGNPHEQLMLLDFFLRHHKRVRALVFVVDPWWCHHVPIQSPPGTFPDWLYGESSLPYATHLLSWTTIERTFQRLSIGLGWHQRRDPTGFFSYEDIWLPGTFREISPPRDPPPAATVAEREMLPDVARLDAAVKKLPAETSVVIVVPPTLQSKMPQPGTPAAADREACNAALKRVVAGRPNSNFINYRIDNALTRDRANFADFIHYRPSIASKIQEGIVASIRDGEAAKIDF
ncbi:hypothetical protein CWO90_41550 [Bradyrhizobium sp. Leo121]|nr:hypothetical protein CWO90_41550 [Bradyrhizobium sp. Leo121]